MFLSCQDLLYFFLFMANVPDSTFLCVASFCFILFLFSTGDDAARSNKQVIPGAEEDQRTEKSEARQMSQ